jgi:hypothetical protein
MVNPKIELRYSGVYDEKYRNNGSVQSHLAKIDEAYPTPDQVVAYKKSVEKDWKKEGTKILNQISKLTRLTWKEEKIVCYVIGFGRPFSDPLTLPIYKKSKRKFIDTLTHELIHQIQEQNSLKTEKWLKECLKEYGREDILTINQILTLAVHWKIFEKLYSKAALRNEMKRYENSPSYRRAWEIVKEETPDKILKSFYKTIL